MYHRKTLVSNFSHTQQWTTILVRAGVGNLWHVNPVWPVKRSDLAPRSGGMELYCATCPICSVILLRSLILCWVSTYLHCRWVRNLQWEGSWPLGRGRDLGPSCIRWLVCCNSWVTSSGLHQQKAADPWAKVSATFSDISKVWLTLLNCVY